MLSLHFHIYQYHIVLLLQKQQLIQLVLIRHYYLMHQLSQMIMNLRMKSVKQGCRNGGIAKCKFC